MSIEDRISRSELNSRNGPLWNNVGAQFDPRVLPPTNVTVSSTFNTTSRQNRVVVVFEESFSPAIDRYDIWYQTPSGQRSVVRSVTGSPAVFDMGSTESLGAAIVYVQPVLRNGIKLDLERCPTAAFLVSV